MMTFGRTCAWEADDDYGFGDDEVEEVACPVDSVEDILEEVRVTRAAELCKEAEVAFAEYRISNSPDPGAGFFFSES